MDDFDTALASVHRQAFIYNCVLASSLVILYYDYLLTLPEEIARYWDSQRKASLAWSLFFLNRYFCLLGHIPIIFQLFWLSSDSRHTKTCAQLVKVHEYMITIGQVIIGICLLLRTYALYGRTRLMLAILTMTALAEMVYVVWQTVAEKGSSTPSSISGFEGCLLPIGPQASSQLRSLWIDQLCFDVLIFALTLYKAVQAFRGGGSSILSIMLRDGTIYFGVMIITAIVGIIDFGFFPSYVRGVTASFGNVLASTMLSRLMLNLRDPKLGSTGGSQGHFTTELDFGNSISFNTSTSDWV